MFCTLRRVAIVIKKKNAFRITITLDIFRSIYNKDRNKMLEGSILSEITVKENSQSGVISRLQP